jgi:hypothetical protein
MATDAMTIAVVAVTTEQSGCLTSTGVGTALQTSTRAYDDDGASSSGTERDAAQSISLEDNSAIVRGGPRTEEPRGEPALANDFIKKKNFFDPIEDDDDIDWKHNPFDVDSIDDRDETPEQLMSQITFEGSHNSRPNSRHWFENSLMYLPLRPAAVE